MKKFNKNCVHVTASVKMNALKQWFRLGETTSRNLIQQNLHLSLVSCDVFMVLEKKQLVGPSISI